MNKKSRIKHSLVIAAFVSCTTYSQVGIGTTTPTNILEVLSNDGTTSTVVDLITLTTNTSGTAAAGLGAGIVFHVEDAGGSEEQGSIDVLLDDVTNGTEDATMTFSINQSGTISEIMRIDGTEGNIGIGSTTPAEPLHIVADTDGEVIRLQENTGAEYWNISVEDDGDLTFMDGTNVVLVIEDANEVGINTAPSDPLHVMSDTGDDAIRIEENSGGEYWRMGVDVDGDFNIENSGTIEIAFLDGGDIGLGETAPVAKVDILDEDNDSYSDVFYLSNASGSPAANDELWLDFWQYDAASEWEGCGGIGFSLTDITDLSEDGIVIFSNMQAGTDTENCMFDEAGQFVPRINNSQTLGSSTKRWNELFCTNNVINTSDTRLKKNITPLNYGLNEIMKLNPISYNWNNDYFTREFEQQQKLKAAKEGNQDPGKDGKNKEKQFKAPVIDTDTHIGVSAQEVAKIIPELSYTGDDENQTMGVRYSGFVPVLIKAIQEQQEQIDELKKELQEIKNNQ